MATPTRSLALLGLVGGFLALGAISLQRGSEAPVYRSDPRYLHDNVHRLSGVLRGRVSLVDVEARDSGETERPLSALRVAVLARSADGSLAIKRTAEVQPSGTFEVLGLPEGEATVLVQIGEGAEVWRAEGVACGRDATADPRLDPILLADHLHWFDLSLVDAEGAPAGAGRLVWRAAGAPVSGAFEGDAAVEAGAALFPATSACIDVVPLIPGAAPELFEGIYGGEELRLGPGVRAELSLTGPSPDPADWNVRVALLPTELRPRIEYAGFEASARAGQAPIVGTLRDRRCSLAFARGGVYHLAWWVAPVGEERGGTLRLPGTPETVGVPAEPGLHQVEVRFPMEAFLERLGRDR